MKKKYIIALFFILVIPFHETFASDIDTLYNRYMQICFKKSSEASVQTALSFLNEDGSFSDLDYNSKDQLLQHLYRLKTLGNAYQSKENKFYKDSTLKKKIFASIQFWVSKDHRPANWWYRHVGYPQEFGPSLFLMNVEMKTEMPQLFAQAIDYLMWAYKKYDHMEGANGADKIFGAYPAAILTQNDTLLKKFQEDIKGLIVVQNQGEGIEPDWMYGQHSMLGRQLYANYEHEYLHSILTLLVLCKGTVYGVTEPHLSILDDHFILGNQWYVYNRHQDPSQTGRRPTSTLNGRFLNNLKLLISLDTPKKDELLVIQDRVINGRKAATKLVGNRMFWRFDYMIHRRDNYFVTSRLTSTRTLGMESGNGEGVNNYYTSAGLNFIFRTGFEFDAPYFEAMNYRQWPGTTVEQDDRKLPSVDWGKRSSNKNPFAGGVSNGFYGAIGTIYKKRSITAHKSWFYFDHEFVALGTGIKQSFGKANVMTTINQVLQKGNITFSQNNNLQILDKDSGTKYLSNLDWVIQDSMAYLNLNPTSSFIIASDSRANATFFTIGIDHGKNPKNEEYAYLVYPNINKDSLQRYIENFPLQILSNSKIVQALYHNDLKIMQAIFFKAGSITLANGMLLTVNKPCAIMIKEIDSIYQISIGNPLCETSNPDSIMLTVNTKLLGENIIWDGTVSTIKINLPQGDYAGKSVTIIARKTLN